MEEEVGKRIEKELINMLDDMQNKKRRLLLKDGTSAD
jgi:hypothetical protein